MVSFIRPRNRAWEAQANHTAQVWALAGLIAGAVSGNDPVDESSTVQCKDLGVLCSELPPVYDVVWTHAEFDALY